MIKRIIPLITAGLMVISTYAEEGSVTLEVQILDDAGNPFYNTPLVRGSIGYPMNFQREIAWPDKMGWVRYEKIIPGPYIFVARSSWPNATIFDVEVPNNGLKTEFRLRAVSEGHRVNDEHPDLNIEVKKVVEKSVEFLEVKLTSNKDFPYTLHETDLNLFSQGFRIFPPKSQQHTGLIVPQRGEGSKTVVLNWNVYVREGIWVTRIGEEIAEKWPSAPPAEDQIYIRVKVGTNGSLPVAVRKPELIVSQGVKSH